MLITPQYRIINKFKEEDNPYYKEILEKLKDQETFNRFSEAIGETIHSDIISSYEDSIDPNSFQARETFNYVDVKCVINSKKVQKFVDTYGLQEDELIDAIQEDDNVPKITFKSSYRDYSTDYDVYVGSASPDAPSDVYLTNEFSFEFDNISISLIPLIKYNKQFNIYPELLEDLEKKLIEFFNPKSYMIQAEMVIEVLEMIADGHMENDTVEIDISRETDSFIFYYNEDDFIELLINKYADDVAVKSNGVEWE